MKQRWATEFLHAKKGSKHWHLPVLAEHYWDQTVDQSTVSGSEFQQCWQQVNSTGAGFLLPAQHTGSTLAKMQSWWWLSWKIVFCSWDFFPSNRALLSFVVSMEISSMQVTLKVTPPISYFLYLLEGVASLTALNTIMPREELKTY